MVREEKCGILKALGDNFNFDLGLQLISEIKNWFKYSLSSNARQRWLHIEMVK